MGKSLSIASNAGYLFSSKLLQRCLAFFTTIALTRYLGPEVYGQYTYVISFVTLLAVFWNFGLDTVLIRDMSRYPSLESNLLGTAIISKGLMFSAIFCLMLLYLFLANKLSMWPSFVLFAVGMFIMNLAGIFNSMFAARRRFDFASLVGVVRSSVLLSAVLLVIYNSLSLNAVFMAYLVSFVVVGVLTLCLVKIYFKMPTFATSPSAIYKLICKSIPFFLTSAVSIFLFRIDQLMLANISGDAVLGQYGAAYTLFEVIISLFPMMLMGTAFPVLARLFREDKIALRKMYSVLFKYFLLFSLPMSVGMAFIGKRLCIALYGIEYELAGSLLLILGLGIWIFFLSTLVSWFLTACDKQKTVLFSNCFALMLNIILNIIFIPVYHGIGAACSTLICELVNFTCMFLVLKKTMFAPELRNTYLKIFFALVVMVIGLVSISFFVSINSHIYYVFVSVLLSTVLYTSSIFFLKLVSPDDASVFLE